MSELSTKNLSELTVITELGENDKVLVESGGRMKKIASSAVGGGGGVLIVDTSDFESSNQESPPK